MKKIIGMLAVLCLIVTLVGCWGGGGNLDGFLTKAEGDWYIHGNSADEMLRVSSDGSWELHGPKDDEGEREVTGFGTISYEEGAKSLAFQSENKFYPTEPVKDGILTFKGMHYFPAEESRDLGERFNGEWYLEGDTDQDRYTFESGMWKFWRGYASTEDGYLEYRGGDRQELLAIDWDTDADEVFAEFSIEGEDEIKVGSQSYMRLEGVDSLQGEENEDPYSQIPDTSIITNSFYYLDEESGSYSLYFYDNGDIDFDSPDETVEGIYSIDEDTIIITWNDTGEEISLTIEDGGMTVVDGQGERFVTE